VGRKKSRAFSLMLLKEKQK
jgi:hypothetical protein